MELVAVFEMVAVLIIVAVFGTGGCIDDVAVFGDVAVLTLVAPLEDGCIW